MSWCLNQWVHGISWGFSWWFKAIYMILHAFRWHIMGSISERYLIWVCLEKLRFLRNLSFNSGNEDGLGYPIFRQTHGRDSYFFRLWNALWKTHLKVENHWTTKHGSEICVEHLFWLLLIWKKQYQTIPNRGLHEVYILGYAICPYDWDDELGLSWFITLLTSGFNHY